MVVNYARAPGERAKALTTGRKNDIFITFMDRTLLLNTTFEPLAIVSWKKAVTLMFLEKVEVIKEYDREVKSVSARVKLPAVLRLLRFVRKNRLNVKFSRKNVFLRDDYICQYCGEPFEPKHLTCDHIVPKSRGGITEWSNIVTSCIYCNLKKGDKLPEEGGMHPLKKPSRPSGFHVLMLNVGLNTLPDYWKDYLFLRD
jgi:5-methylcytosine-specific restriction endonuclease McrA